MSRSAVHNKLARVMWDRTQKAGTEREFILAQVPVGAVGTIVGTTNQATGTVTVEFATGLHDLKSAELVAVDVRKHRLQCCSLDSHRTMYRYIRCTQTCIRNKHGYVNSPRAHRALAREPTVCTHHTINTLAMRESGGYNEVSIRTHKHTPALTLALSAICCPLMPSHYGGHSDECNMLVVALYFVPYYDRRDTLPHLSILM